MHGYNVYAAQKDAQKALFEQGAEAHLNDCLEHIKKHAAEGEVGVRLMLPESMSENMVNFLIDCLKSLGFQAELSTHAGGKNYQWIKVFWGLPVMVPGIHTTTCGNLDGSASVL